MQLGPFDRVEKVKGLCDQLICTDQVIRIESFPGFPHKTFRLFHAENLSWPQRNAIRDKMLMLFEEMLVLENTAA